MLEVNTYTLKEGIMSQYKGYSIADDGRVIGLHSGCSQCFDGVREGHYMCSPTPLWVREDTNLYSLYQDGAWVVYVESLYDDDDGTPC